MPPAKRGASGGLLAPVPVPVGVEVWRLRVFHALLGDPRGIRPDILRALGETNLNGAGGFFVVGGAVHACSIPHNPHRVSNGGWKFVEFLRGLHLAPSRAR